MIAAVTYLMQPEPLRFDSEADYAKFAKSTAIYDYGSSLEKIPAAAANDFRVSVETVLATAPFTDGNIFANRPLLGLPRMQWQRYVPRFRLLEKQVPGFGKL